MKTTLDAVDIVWKFLDASSLKTAITGKIYKNQRPLDSEAEDVVINSLPINNGQVQEGVMNVNIFVPNKPQQISERQDNTIADHARLKELATLATGLLKDIFLVATDCGFDVQQQSVIEDGETHFVNIRIDFYSINLN
jgi:hypothetical protein